jgi:DNA-binding beta-propeller fold protein YncE
MINSNNGALSVVGGSPFPAGSGPMVAAVDPTDKFLYVANHAGNVSAYKINSSNGALSVVGGSPFPAESGSSGIAIATVTGP